MKSPQSFDQDIRERLEALKATPPRRPEAAEKGRAAYMQSARNLRKEYIARTSLAQQMDSRHAVSVPFVQRLKGWINEMISSPIRKENYRMAGTLIAIVVAVSLMFGSAGAVFAAQDSLPDDVLYPVKILSEDTRLGLTADPLREMKMNLDFADRRVGEMGVMTKAGDPVPQEVAFRLQTHLNLALKAAAGLGDDTIGQALEQARVRMEQQLQVLNQIQAKDPQGTPLLVPIRAQLRWMIGQAELGVVDPTAFRLQLRLNAQGPNPLDTPGEGGPYGAGSQGAPGCPDCTPQVNGESYGPGPYNQGTITQTLEGYGPGPSYGPGPNASGIYTGTVEPSYDGGAGGSNSNQGGNGGTNGGSGGNGGGNGGGGGGGNGGGGGGGG